MGCLQMPLFDKTHVATGAYVSVCQSWKTEHFGLAMKLRSKIEQKQIYRERVGRAQRAAYVSQLGESDQRSSGQFQSLENRPVVSCWLDAEHRREAIFFTLLRFKLVPLLNSKMLQTDSLLNWGLIVIDDSLLVWGLTDVDSLLNWGLTDWWWFPFDLRTNRLLIPFWTED